jgi:protocatechuate 3,4-dioxygenase beta subunit
VLPGTSVSYDFAIANGSESQDTFDLTTSSSQGWADLSGVPASVTIAGGATAHVVIPVNVPASAANGTVEETILAAVSQSNPLVNDTASVRTTVGTPLPTTSQLVGWTFLDTNGDGWRQANEQAGLAGVSLTLTQSGTPVAQTRSVGVDGWYHFNSVMPGQYCLRAAIPSQYVATSPAQVCFNVVAGTDKIVNFGVQQARAAIGDYVWYDDNANGVQDPGELGLAGVTLDLLSNNGGAPGDMVATATTDADGRYLFDPVAPGAYFVQVTDTQGRLVGHTHTIGPQSRPNPFGPITVVHGQTYLEADFGYAVLPGPGQAVIGDRVWLDANGNGVQDAGEVGIAGVRICASPMGHASDVCGHTDQGGFYHLLVTAPRTYMVTVVAPPAGKQATTPVFYLPVGVGPGDRYQVADFGYR